MGPGHVGSEIQDDKGSVKKRALNPDVMMQLGYAAAVLGWGRTILVMNRKYRSREWLPFDLKTYRFSGALCYTRRGRSETTTLFRRHLHFTACLE
jgi:hypothetical protein